MKTRNQFISELTRKVLNNNNNNKVVVEDVWVNSSGDNEGEDIQVETLEFDGSDFGVYLANDDFYPLNELTDNELERLYEDVC